MKTNYDLTGILLAAGFIAIPLFIVILGFAPEIADFFQALFANPQGGYDEMVRQADEIAKWRK